MAQIAPMGAALSNVQSALAEVHERERWVAVIRTHFVLDRLKVMSELRNRYAVDQHACEQGDR